MSITVLKEGKEYIKVISTGADEQYVYGSGTGTRTSSLYKGKESKESVFAEIINKANNKAIMLTNAFFEEIGL